MPKAPGTGVHGLQLRDSSFSFAHSSRKRRHSEIDSERELGFMMQRPGVVPFLSTRNALKKPRGATSVS